MTEALAGLYPTNNIGSDGFNWFIGQVESVREDDAKGSGRFKVRIVGHHPKTCEAISSETLGWAQTIMPVNAPHLAGGVTSITPQLESGVWVVGFFLDGDKQRPCIIGSIGRVANSMDGDDDEDPTPGESGCKSFTTFVNPENQVGIEQASTGEFCEWKPTTPQAGHVAHHSSVPASFAAKYSRNSESNPGGIDWCIEKADRCGKETDLKGTFTRLIGELLYETQRNGGKLGTYLVSDATGELRKIERSARKYVNKAIRVVRAFVANIKGWVVARMKEATKEITDILLKPTKKGNSLKKLTKFFNDNLAKVGCKMADLSDRLTKFIENIIYGYLFNIYKETACQVDKFIEGLINQIQAMMNELLESILGPLQSLLGSIASTINIIGDAINYVLTLLGIECSGPPKRCAKVTKICTDCGSDEREDFLDRLLEDLEGWPDGADWTQYTCEDSYQGTKLRNTNIIFVGGIQNPTVTPRITYSINDVEVREGGTAIFTVTRSGKIDIPSSVTYGTRNGTAKEDEDYQEVSGVLGFVPGQTEKQIEVVTFTDSDLEGNEDFYMRIFKDSPGTVKASATRNIGKCTIREGSITTGTQSVVEDDVVVSSNPSFPSSNPLRDNLFPEPEIPTSEVGGAEDPDQELLPSYTVTPDRITVKEGEFVTYDILTKNVPSGTTLSYSLFGDSITPSDVISNNLEGTFVIQNNTAKVIVGISEDNVTEDQEILIFAISGTGAQASVAILSDTSSFSNEDILDIEDSSSPEIPGTTKPRLPDTENPITGPTGDIIQIPVNNPGDPYQEPPNVFITGNGHGSSAEALLDNKGYLVEIRVINPGFGYKLNTPQDAGKECIIDSFTMIRPGQGYTSTPLVYINGDPTIAEAVIDKGRVVSVRIINRELTFSEYPEVKILGGGGSGAKFMPSFACLDPDIRVKIGSAKVGTGSYIDCP